MSSTTSKSMTLELRNRMAQVTFTDRNIRPIVGMATTSGLPKWHIPQIGQTVEMNDDPTLFDAQCGDVVTMFHTTDKDNDDKPMCAQCYFMAMRNMLASESNRIRGVMVENFHELKGMIDD